MAVLTVIIIIQGVATVKQAFSVLAIVINHYVMPVL